MTSFGSHHPADRETLPSVYLGMAQAEPVRFYRRRHGTAAGGSGNSRHPTQLGGRYFAAERRVVGSVNPGRGARPRAPASYSDAARLGRGRITYPGKRRYAAIGMGAGAPARWLQL